MLKKRFPREKQIIYNYLNGNNCSFQSYLSSFAKLKILTKRKNM